MTEFVGQQLEALDAVDAFLNDDDRRVFRLDGYAGTGKTTMALEIAERARARIRRDVVFGALTGKAADVLSSKGCWGAATIHSLIYNPKEKAEDRLEALKSELNGLQKVFKTKPTERMLQLVDDIELERENLSRPAFVLNWESPLLGAGLFIGDERSMIDTALGQDLLRFKCKLLLLGDPAQLPPVDGDSFMVDTPPDYMLTEIHRQAADNAIIHLATRARQGEMLLPGDYNDAIVKLRATDDDLLWADQVLCGRNNTRQLLNWRMRDLRGIGRKSPPQVGEKLVCLRNNRHKGLKNGTTWEVVEAPDSGSDVSQLLTLRGDSGQTVHTVAWKDVLTGLPPASKLYNERKGLDEFDYGYALTVHKSQGSQWDKVCLVDESRVFEEDGHKWLYTGITRAAKQLLVVRG